MEGEKDKAGGKKMSMVLGPWGGNGGSYWDDGIYSGVREIALVYGCCIDSIRVVYDKDGKPVTTEKHGGVGGDRAAEIKLQFPEELLTTVSGHYSPFKSDMGPVIRSLTFKSNLRTYGPFGVEDGTPFSFSIDGGSIVGFKGRSGWYLDAIGFHLLQVQKTKNLSEKVQKKLDKLESEKDQVGGKKMSILVGPWGGKGGAYWDDGSYSGVREITLVYGRCIDSIRVVYDKNGKPVTAEKHGGVGGSRTGEIKLQFPEEFLTSVSGHYSSVAFRMPPVIRSLTFKSNQRTYGPFGVEEGTPFSFSVDGGSIVGFKGRSGWYLDEIGFHISGVDTTPKLYQKVQSQLKRLASTAPKTWPLKYFREP